LMYFIEGLYSLKTYNPANLSVSILRGTILSVFVSVILLYLLPLKLALITPKTNLILIAFTTMFMMLIWKRYFFRYFASDKQLRSTILIGSQSTLDLVDDELSHKPHLGYGILASLTTEEALDFDTSLDVELVAIERNVIKNPALYNHYFTMLGKGIEVMDLAKFAEKISGKIPLAAIDESWFVEYCGHQESRSYDTVKSMMDRMVAITLTLIIAPFYLLLIGILLLFHGRPIFFSQTRTGQNNQPFTLYKLRTMVVDAEKAGAQWAKPKDARITAIGKFLRKTRLDELPQLLNIMKGEMSLVGPRPERPEMIDKTLAPNIPFYNLRHLVKPGVTGWAQVSFRYGFSQEDSAEKLQYDLYYVKNKNPWLDIIVIFKTIKTVLTGAGQ
jgi:exopolysaccharide biosynthesis polyprenyl glycosylphosphotransferase